ncbi:extracellular solute-binding protein [Variovorax sp. dw_308]|uniref:extracellular solute-binding protein n=1 Tax=Variovorax sp. dw_308 TaxID=2721546 RepID=UPI001C46DFC9|nr:extracellular solute-binding protein [Variovorax sp. dw_308]
MKSRNFRHAVALISAATLAVALPASIANAQQRFDGVTLRVGTYGGPWGDAVNANVGKKLEAMGAKVEYVVGNPADNFAKVVSARGRASPIDVMEIGPAERLAMTRNDFLEDLPVEMIPNLSKLSVQVADKKAIAHQMVQNGILYRVDSFNADKLPVPKRFEDLQDPKFASKTAFPDVTNPQHWPAVSAMASDAGGSESTPEKGFEQVLKIKPLYFYGSATELTQKMTMGDVVAATSHAGMAVRLANAGQQIGFVHPQIGGKRGEIEYNYLGIVKGTKNKEAAAAFINAFLDTQSQANFAKPMGVVPTNREARAILEKDPVMSKFMLLSDKDLANTYTMDWSKVDVEKWRAAWARTVSK